jgi:hypothetical protein
VRGVKTYLVVAKKLLNSFVVRKAVVINLRGVKIYLVVAILNSFVVGKPVKARKWCAKNGWRFDEFLHTLN